MFRLDERTQYRVDKSGMLRLDESAKGCLDDSPKNRLFERATRLETASVDAMGAVGN